MMKNKLYTIIISIVIIFITYTPLFAKSYFPNNVYGNNTANWVTYYKQGNNFKLQVLVNGENLIGESISGEKGIVFVTRDIITNKYKWDDMYKNAKISSVREVAFWNEINELYDKSLGITILYILIYKDKYTNRYQTYCYKASLYNVYGELVCIKKDNLGDYHLPYLDEIPKLQKAINKWLEVNNYNSLDELFREKGVN